jgi:hypothetical protein
VVKRYLLNILIAVDQLLNTLLFGDPDETISSRCGKAIRRAKTPRKWTIAYWLNKFLDLFEKDHCLVSIEDDEGKDGII